MSLSSTSTSSTRASPESHAGAPSPQTASNHGSPVPPPARSSSTRTSFRPVQASLSPSTSAIAPLASPAAQLPSLSTSAPASMRLPFHLNASRTDLSRSQADHAVPPDLPQFGAISPSTSHATSSTYDVPTNTTLSPTSNTSGPITNPAININTGTSTPKTQPNRLAAAAPRSSSLPFVTMGQAFSKSNTSAASASSIALHLPPQTASSSNQLAATKGVVNAGLKLKRALARRKKTDDVNRVVGDGKHIHNEDTTQGGVASGPLQGQMGGEPQQHQLNERQQPIQYTPSTSSAPVKVITTSSLYSSNSPSSLSPLSTNPPFSTSPSTSNQPLSNPRPQRLAQFATQMFNAGRKAAAAAASTLSVSPPTTPPPVPPKAGLSQQQFYAVKRARPPSPVKTAEAQRQRVNNRASIIPVSPGISSAVNYMRLDAIEQERLMDVQEIGERHAQPGPSYKPSMPFTTPSEPQGSSEVLAGGIRYSQEGQNEERRSAEKEDEQGPSAETKEIWRKSDSTMSYHTIRPGSTNTSRPVSEAGSSHTVVPVKRLSALIGDADFGMPEEDDTDIEVMDASSFHADTRDSQWDVITPRATAPSSSFPSVSPLTSTPGSTPASISAATKAKNRRSLSLNVGPNGITKLAGPSTNATPVRSRPLPQPPHNAHTVSVSCSVTTPSSNPYQHELNAVTRANTGGIDIPNPAGHTSPADQGRGWAGLSPPSTNSSASTSTTSITANSKSTPPSSYQSHPRYDRTPPAPLDNAGSPPPILNVTSSTQSHRLPHNPMPSRTLAAPPIIRQTAISMSSTLAPAAGFARRAAEKMGWPWSGHSSHGHGHSNNSSNANSGYSSSASSSHGHDEPLGGKRRTPNAPSAAWSITSNSSSIVESEYVPQQPYTGKRLRGPRTATTGMVFGKDLKVVVRETACHIVKQIDVDEHVVDWEEPPASLGLPPSAVERWGQAKSLASRMLPALALRCAQHLLIWGVQEEGLFRVTGRPAHITKIRKDFDSGADFDMIECNPGDLDPHAVSSVFKAFLRELPEPILTHALMPFFEAALAQENNTIAQEGQSSGQRNMVRGPGLPSNPRLSGVPAMRKPPSLSTLAVPSATGMRPASKTLVTALTNLIAQLPRENRDLLKTVTDLMKATAKESKTTKMPLSNLLLVFCPSLNMNPPLLRALCEVESIWGDDVDLPLVIDIKRQTVVPETVTPPPNERVPPPPPLTRASSSQDGEEEFSDASESLDQGPQEYEDGSSQSDSFVSEEDPTATARLRPRIMARMPMPMYPNEDGPDDSSVAEEGGYNRDTIHARTPSVAASYDTPSLQDDVSYISTSEGNSLSRPDAPSPAFSLSSAESLATPPASSADPSLAHLPLEQDLDLRYLQLQPASDPAIHPLDAPSPPRPLVIKKKSAKTPNISNPIPISNPILFPGSVSSSSSSSPDLGNPTSTLESKRRSVPTLSLPNIGLFSDSPASPDHSTPSLPRRIKRPSLHLFSKRSSSSLTSPSPRSASMSISSPFVQTPRSASDSSVSTPISAVTAPQMLSSTSTLPPLPPQLGTPIKTSTRLSLDFGVAREEVQEEEESIPIIQEPIATVKPGETPIANLYRSGSFSSFRSPSPQPISSSSSSAGANHLRPQPGRTRLGALGLLGDEPAEDWTQSVLSAADFSWSTGMTTSASSINPSKEEKDLGIGSSS